eukprot:1161688-Pelagomonas_calceolata.AAC.1
MLATCCGFMCLCSQPPVAVAVSCRCSQPAVVSCAVVPCSWANPCLTWPPASTTTRRQYFVQLAMLASILFCSGARSWANPCLAWGPASTTTTHTGGCASPAAVQFPEVWHLQRQWHRCLLCVQAMLELHEYSDVTLPQISSMPKQALPVKELCHRSYAGMRYPCDLCHEELSADGHGARWAQRMVCGECMCVCVCVCVCVGVRLAPMSNQLCADGHGARWAQHMVCGECMCVYVYVCGWVGGCALAPMSNQLCADGHGARWAQRMVCGVCVCVYAWTCACVNEQPVMC